MIPHNTLKLMITRNLQKMGVEEPRVGYAAIIEMQKLLEDVCLQVTKQALEFATHSERGTIQAPDVKMGAKVLRLDILSQMGVE